MRDVSGVTIDNVDFSYAPGGLKNGQPVYIYNLSGAERSNAGFTVKNCKFQDRSQGIYIYGGKDATITGNEFINCGSNNYYSVLLSDVTPGVLPVGILMNNNTWDTGNGIYINNTFGLTIGDENVAGAHITIEDASGFHTINRNYGLRVLNSSKLRIEDINLESPTLTNSYGILVEMAVANFDTKVINCKVGNHYSGVTITGGKDATVTGCDFTNSGNNSLYALAFNNVGRSVLPGGVEVSGCTWNGGQSGLALYNMTDVVIGDENIANADITIEDNSGFNTVVGNSEYNRGALLLYTCTNIMVDDIDAGYTGSTSNSFGIYVQNFTSWYNYVQTQNGNITIQNCKTGNRRAGIRIAGGFDYTVKNNDLSGSGNNGFFALEFRAVRKKNLKGGVDIAANIFSNTCNSGVWFDNMQDLNIKDAAAVGVNVVLEDNSGLNQIQGGSSTAQGVIYLSNCSDVHMESIDASYDPGAIRNAFGLRINNPDHLNGNITVKDCKFSNRQYGIYGQACGYDITVEGCDLTNCGIANNNWSVYLNDIIGKNILPGGLRMSGNSFGAGSRHGVYLTNIADLVIGDENVGAAHVVLEDNSGLNTLVGGDRRWSAVLNVHGHNLTIDDIDATNPAVARQVSTGIWASHDGCGAGITIQNCSAQKKERGIYCRDGYDFTVTNNDVSDSGYQGYYDTDDIFSAISFYNVEGNTIPGGVAMSTNTFGNTNGWCRSAVSFMRMKGMHISNSNAGGATVILEDGMGLTETAASTDRHRGSVLYFANCQNVTIDDVDMSYTGAATPNGYGMAFVDAGWATTENFDIQNCDFDNRRSGIYADVACKRFYH